MPTMDRSSLIVGLAGLIVFILIVLFGYHSYGGIRESAISEIQSDIESDNRLITETVSARLSLLSLLAELGSSHIETVLRFDQTLNSPENAPFLERFRTFAPEIRTAVVIDRDGMIIEDTRPNRPGVGIDVSDRGYFRAHTEGRDIGIHVSLPVVSRVDGQWTWVVSAAIRSDAGDLLGVILVSIDREYFARLFLATGSDGGGIVNATTLVFHNTGVIMEADADCPCQVGDTVSEAFLEQLHRPFSPLDTVAAPWAPETQIAVNHRHADPWPIFVLSYVDPHIVTNHIALAADRIVVATVLMATISAASTALALMAVRSLRRSANRAQVAQRMAEHEKQHADEANQAKTQFLAAMSHDLRTPLNAIMGFADAMRLKSFGPLSNPRYDVYIQDILYSASVLTRLVNDLLDTSKIDSGAYLLNEEHIDLLELIRATVSEISILANMKSQEIDFDADQTAVVIIADRRAMQQVLTNILSNAIKFSPDGSRTTIDLTADRDDGLQIQVRDQGPGIGSHGADLFQPFVRGNNRESMNTDGAGLGLYICRKLLEIHGGSIDIADGPGNGAIVTVLLPATRIASLT